MLLGDTHANLRWTAFTIDQAAALDVDLIIQLGDFGYWPNFRSGPAFMQGVEKTLAEYNLALWFLDGNHEDHWQLHSADRPPGAIRLTNHVTYLPRGTRWTWAGTTWLTIGGASSVDRDWRNEGIDWFAEETLTIKQQHVIADSGHADVVIAHDAPWGVPFLTERLKLQTPPEERGGWPVDALRDSDRHMHLMSAMLDATQPGTWFHGHHHVCYNDWLATDAGQVHVYGLAHDSGSLHESALLVDATGTVLDWPSTQLS